VRPDELCGLLAEDDRLAVFAAVVLGAATPEAVTSATGLPPRAVERALSRLLRGGLVGTSAGLTAGAATFKDAVRAHAPAPEPVEPLDPDPRRDAVLRTFLSGGRLVQMPAARGKRRVVLEHIASVFEPGVKYPEAHVDAILRAWTDDHVTLRRYLVDEYLLARENGRYWRTGGYVDVVGG
jgi:hypothetical protein